MSSFLSFHLTDTFVETYNSRKVNWGLQDAGGTSLSELTFLTKYSRLKDDGSKETWQDVCRRVVEGTYSIQKDWAKSHHLPWNDHKAARSAQEMFDRMFNFKWTPPGRGLQNMGTQMVNGLGYSTALQNCGAVALGTLQKNNPGEPFSFLMSASMMGVGIGYSLIGVDKLDIRIGMPSEEKCNSFVVPDSREGWAEATRLLINAFLIPGSCNIAFNYSEIRPEGMPIKSFGTKAPGPEPLKKLHRKLIEIFHARLGEKVDSVLLSDIANLVGKCVVSGNTRRSALLSYGELTDENFINLKNFNVYPERTGKDGWAFMSNNSVRANADSDLSSIIESIQLNGEPGIIWEDVVKSRGRLVDPPDYKDSKFVSFNPCAEQPLENREFCTLADIYVNNIDDLEDLQRTIKFAFLYTKTVTLLPTHFEDSNAVMQRNRRIGLSLSGITDFIDERTNGLQQLRGWLSEGFNTVLHYDEEYSEWLCIRTSIRHTTIKPGGTTSLVAGCSAGGHWTDGGAYYVRAQRFPHTDPIVALARLTGHKVEVDVMNPDTTSVVYFPIKSRARRSARQVSLFEKAALAVELQRLWSDNSVSVTLTFDPETEADNISTVLNMYAGQLKSVSFLPTGNTVYLQQPYTEITAEEYEEASMELLPMNLADLYKNWEGGDVADDAYCTTDVCEIKEEMSV